MKLEALCRYRAQAEDYVRLEAAELDYRWQEAAARYDERRRRADAAATHYCTGSGTGTAVSETTWQYHAWEAAAQDAARAEDVMVKAQLAREAKQAELALAIRERKQMELMVRRRARLLQLQQRRREQREMDDFANGRWAHALRRESQDEGGQ